ncbi:winged helix-turn-helix transcriptional regulator [Fusobacterium sp. PH5-44]|uniref:winged helix-turn-helix transcriptional regulator n=1 Tax=unclassified Fusobacterium TaxID=2648384 RepID=UPI003D20AC74
MKYIHKLEKDAMCPIEYGLDIFGGKWKSRIICVLPSRSVMRYNEIKKELNNITDTVLAMSLKELINDAIIERKQYNEIPLKVEYTLSPLGVSVLPILQYICQWSRAYSKEDLEKKLPSCKSCSQLKNS